MYFQFAPLIQAGLTAGKYAQVFTSSGIPIGMVREAATGRFVAHAIGMAAQSGSLSPVTAPVEVVMGLAQMYQTHQGFQKTYREIEVVKNGITQLQASVGVLQSTTALIGVGVAATGVLSAVNLWQTQKLREDLKQQRLEIKQGFIDLKKALQDQGKEILDQIDEVAKDLKYEMHHLQLVKAYERFVAAIHLMKTAMLIEDKNARNSQLSNVLPTLSEAAQIYRSPALLSDTCAAGKLRRLECAWTMEQTIAFNQHLQGHGEAVSYCLDHLQEKMNHDLLSLVDQCSSEEELEFLFPEITRIQHHDVAVLESWKNHTNWMQSLSPSEKEELANLEPTETDSSNISQGDIATTEPWEMQLYKDLKKKSHYSALQDQLKFIVKPELRRHHESYIQEQAIAQNRQGLIPNNWQEVPDFTVTNLYHYLKNSDPWSNQLK